MRITIEIPDSASLATTPSTTTATTDGEQPRDGGSAPDAGASPVAVDAMPAASAQNGGSYGGEVGFATPDFQGATDGGEASK